MIQRSVVAFLLFVTIENEKWGGGAFRLIIGLLFVRKMYQSWIVLPKPDLIGDEVDYRGYASMTETD